MILADATRSSLLVLLSLGIATLLAISNSDTENRSYTKNIAASINGKTLDRSEYIDTLNALSTDRRNKLQDRDRMFILKRLIEEQLLVQHALDNNFITTDRTLRTLIAGTMIESILATSPSTSSDEVRIRNYYAEHFNKPNTLKPKLAVLRKEIGSRLLELDQDKAIETYIEWLRNNSASRHL